MKTNTKQTLKYYLQAAKKHWLAATILFLSMLGVSLIGVITPLYYKDFIDRLAQGLSEKESNQTILQALIWLLIIISTFKFGGLILRRLNNFTLNYFDSIVVAELNDFCFAELHKRSFNYFNNNFVGSLTKKVKWFVNAFEAIADRLVWNVLPLIVSVVFIVGVFWSINRYLALGVIVWLVLFLVINWIFTKFKMKYDLQRTELETKSTAILADTVTNNANVKLFNGYAREVKSYSDTNEKLRKVRRWTWDIATVFDTVQGFFMVSLEVGIMSYAIYLWTLGQFTIGDFTLVQAYIGNLIDKLWDFGGIIRWTYQNLADAEEMTELLETPPEILDIPQAKKLRDVKGEIVLSNVNFKYPNNWELLNNFSLTIRPRERLAIIGPSGAGKSTIIKLLFRMHDVSAGKILIDGQDIAKVTQESLWQNVSLVPQDPILFHRTLKENIRYGLPKATDKEIIAAAKAAHCHEFISKMSLGYDTMVGERGIKLSGGERQRVAIARAILKNSPILVLDEATSSLDSESEGLIQDALDKLMRDKTVIVIAHRLSTIRKMDRIITVDNGKIVEDGSHNEMLHKKGGIYAKLWKLQAGGFIE